MKLLLTVCTLVCLLGTPVNAGSWEVEIADSEGEEAVWNITTPDGEKYSLRAPHDATQAEILKYVKENIPATSEVSPDTPEDVSLISSILSRGKVVDGGPTIGNPAITVIVLLISWLTAFVLSSWRRGILFVLMSLVAGSVIGFSVSLFLVINFSFDDASKLRGLGMVIWLPILATSVGTWFGCASLRKRDDHVKSNEERDVQESDADPSLSDLPSSSVEASLRQIKDFLDQGLIDQEDYDRKKRDILDDM